MIVCNCRVAINYCVPPQPDQLSNEAAEYEDYIKFCLKEHDASSSDTSPSSNSTVTVVADRVAGECDAEVDVDEFLDEDEGSDFDDEAYVAADDDMDIDATEVGRGVEGNDQDEGFFIPNHLSR